MRRALLIIALGLALTALAAVPGSAAARTTINCANSAGTKYKPKQSPSQCVRFGSEGSFAGGVFLENLVWSGFGAATATATGIECGFHLPCAQIPVTVSAYRLKKGCGSRAYTRLQATSSFGTTTVKMKPCPGTAL